jgi:exportin-2 (importin alpha re-exporter)
MKPFSQTIFMLLLNRLQSKPTQQFTQGFVYFFTFLAAVDNVGADAAIGILEGIQPGLFGNLMNGVILPNTQKAPVRSRRVIEVGLTKILARSDTILAPTMVTFWVPIFLALVDLFTLPQDITYTGANGDDLNGLDHEDTGFQSSFSKLGASERNTHDPVASVTDTKMFAARELSQCSQKRPGVVGPLIQQAQAQESVAVTSFVQFMSSNK